jgi:hypothetical protein
LPPWFAQQLLALVSLALTIPACGVLLFRFHYLRKRRMRLAGWLSLALAVAAVLVQIAIVRMTVDTVTWRVCEQSRADSAEVFRILLFSDKNPELNRVLGLTADAIFAEHERFRFLRGGMGYFLRHQMRLKPPPADPTERAEYFDGLALFLRAVDRILGRSGGSDLRMPADDARTILADAKADADHPLYSSRISRRVARLLDRSLTPQQAADVDRAWARVGPRIAYDFSSIDRFLFRHIRDLLDDLLPLPLAWAVRHQIDLALFGMTALAYAAMLFAMAWYFRRTYARANALRMAAMVSDEWSDEFLAHKASVERKYLLEKAEAIEHATVVRPLRIAWRGLVCRVVFGMPDTTPLWRRQNEQLAKLLTLAREHATPPGGEGEKH